MNDISNISLIAAIWENWQDSKISDYLAIAELACIGGKVNKSDLAVDELTIILIKATIKAILDAE